MTMFASAARSRMRVTKQSAYCGHSRPRHCSLVAVSSVQSDESSGRSSISLRSPVAVAAGPLRDALEPPALVGRQSRRGFTQSLESMQAEEVRAAFHVGRANLEVERARERRQIFVEDLILQRACARGDEHAAAGQHRRNEVRERLAGARARLGDEGAARVDDARDLRGEPALTGPRLEALERGGDRTGVGERVLDAIREA